MKRTSQLGFYLFLSFQALQSSCVTLPGKPERQGIESSMSLDEAFQLAISQGKQSMTELKRLVKARQAWNELSQMSLAYMKANLGSTNRVEFSNAISLYQASSPEVDPSLIELLLAKRDPFYTQLALQLASLRPSPKVGETIEKELSKAITQGREDQILSPQLATAIRLNAIGTSYSLMRRGLLLTGEDEFAKTMISSDPNRAAWDFMDYLARADLDDLRQLSQKTVNMYTCLVILRFYLNHPLPVAHPQFKNLIYYAVSRNSALSEMARSVLEAQIPNFKDQIAYWLATEKLEVQIAFIESARQNPTPNIKLMLGNLKEITRFKEVAEEIDAIQRF
jgi:hypothetical protein